jgi:hypothetical protein
MGGKDTLDDDLAEGTQSSLKLVDTISLLPKAVSVTEA